MSNITIYTFRATVSNCKRIKKTSGIMYPQFICVILLFCRTLGDCGWCCCCHRWRSHSLAVHSSIHQNILWHRTYRNTPHTHQHNNPNEMRTREWERESVSVCNPCNHHHIWLDIFFGCSGFFSAFAYNGAFSIIRDKCDVMFWL